MKTLISFFILFTFIIKSYSQEAGVPYRVGNKFGISDREGNLIVQPQFDLINPKKYDNNPYFECFKFNEQNVLSSLFYKNKMIIKDMPYHNYRKSNNFFTAVKYFPKGSNSVEEIEALYDHAGKRIFEEDFKDVGVIDKIDENDILEDALILTTGLDNQYSLFLYNKKLKKVIKTFFDKSRYLDIRYNSEYRPNDKSIVFTYMDKTNKGMQIKIDVDAKKTIQIVESKPYQIREKSQNSSIESYGIEGDILDIDFPMDLNNTNKNLTGRIYKIQKVEVSRFFYWEITKPDKIIIKEEVLKPNDGYILSENGKQGYFSSGYNKLIVPVQFDEVLKAEFTGHNGGYILRNGNKYGLFIYDFKLPNSRIIDPVFDKIPLLVNYDYFKEKDPLIKLYDKAGYFYCYANGDGILYCSEK